MTPGALENFTERMSLFIVNRLRSDPIQPLLSPGIDRVNQIGEVAHSINWMETKLANSNRFFQAFSASLLLQPNLGFFFVLRFV